jgi:hypothetical protein
LPASHSVQTGVNFSPAIVNPFRQLGPLGEGLERVLAGQRVESDDPVLVAVHFTSPVIDYLDRGKSSIALRGSGTSDEPEEQENPDHWLYEVEPNCGLAARLVEAVKAVTKPWLKQRKAEDRDSRAYERRELALKKQQEPGHEKMTAVAFEVMERGYRHASNDDQLPANVRQIMYAIRDEVNRRCGMGRSGKGLTGDYFSQTLLPDYIADYDPPWKNKIAYDDRGHFSEPHTGRMIGLGTVAVRNYIARLQAPKPHIDLEVGIKTFGPMGRYAGVLFIEKEGFDALIEETQIAERHDLAFMSCKGLSVTAARELADNICHTYKLPLYLLVDFDKAGITGTATFEQDNRRYTWRNDIKVVRLGLRIDDVRDLAAERGVSIEALSEQHNDLGKPEARHRNMIKNGATEEEAKFLLTRRVELNVMTSVEFVAYVERKLEENGVRKVVPDAATLAEAYRTFVRGEEIRRLIAPELAKPNDVRVPKDLKRRVQAYLQEHPEVPWDVAVARIANPQLTS